MGIIFGGDSGIVESSYSGFLDAINKELGALSNSLTNLTGGKWTSPPPAERVFVDDGFSNVPGTSFIDSTIDNVDDVKTRRVTTQEPSLTVYIKKRAFSGLKDENTSIFMDAGEKLYMRATKMLFEKKCAQIASYEALTKMSKLISEDAELDADLIRNIADLVRTFKENSSIALEDETLSLTSSSSATDEYKNEIMATFSNELRKLEQVEKLADDLDMVAKKQSKLRQSTYTNWVIDHDSVDVFGMGRGSGVIELTIVDSINTSLTIDAGQGRVDFTIDDPYNITKITTDDVEIALSSAYAELKLKAGDESFNSKGASYYLEEARRKEEQLRAIRDNKVASFFGLEATAIGNSKASEIIFEINAASYSSQRVAAYTTYSGTPSYSSNDLRFSMINLPVEQQLGVEESKLVEEIFDLLLTYTVYIEDMNKSVIKANSDRDVQYARRNLRMHYLGKAIVQPMDSVHIFVRGNKYKQGELLGPLSTFLNTNKFTKVASENQEVSDAFLKEEMKQFGLDKLDIKPEIYRSFRTGSFMRNAGMHIFGGLINNVTGSYNASSGKHTLNVGGESNLRWLDLSRVNTKPSLMQPQGMLEDPLTPFSYEVDESTGLISGEPKLLPDNEKAMVTNSNIPIINVEGKRVTKENHKDDYIPTERELMPIFDHSPGMVYKWKPGVAVVTQDVNLQKSLQGGENDTQKLKRFVGLNIVDQPFAGLDAADIISLLVTGYPHSAEKFYKAASQTGAFRTSGNNESPSFFHSFFDITRSTNKSLGNFQPFRSIESVPSTLAAKIRVQRSLSGNYEKIDKLRSDLAKNRDRLVALARPQVLQTFEPDDPNEQDRKITARAIEDIIANLNSKIRIAEDLVNASKKDAKDSGIVKDVDGLVFKLDQLSGGPEGDANKESEVSIRLKNRLTQFKTQYDCKFNQSENYFIVSDEYDTDVNIQAFVIGLLSQDQNLMNSEYEKPIDICTKVAKTLDFEFFCDTQGNLVFRPPQYNKVPLSLILKMFALHKGNGVQLYPASLQKLFGSRLGNTKEQESIVDAQIKEQAILLNLYDRNSYLDLTPEDLIKQFTSNSTKAELIEGQQFISPYESGFSSDDAEFAEFEVEKIVSIRNEIEGKIGYKSPLQDADVAKKKFMELNDPKNPQVNTMRLSAFNKLKDLLSKKLQLRDLSAKIEAQGNKYKDGIGNFSKDKLNGLIAPFQNLIEDDFNDFLGPGSSKRFIIYDEDVISSTFTENDGGVLCRVDVNGQENLIGQEGTLISGLKTIWAGATDFDLWRQYGYRSDGPVSKPFLKDAQSQCAPYALFLLARARRDVVRGNVVLPGNEFYQLGDVVYINSRDMLFYVTAVKHSFSYSSGTYTTTLDLRYGRTLGDYISTPLDVIGQGLIRDQSKFNKILVTRETSNKKRGVHLGLVVFTDQPDSGASDAVEEEFRKMLTDPYAVLNVEQLKNALLSANNAIESNNKDKFPKVEVRGWVIDDKQKELTYNRMKAVIKWLQNPWGRWVHNEKRYIVIGDQYTKHPLQANSIYNIVVEGTKEDGKKSVRPVNLKNPLEGEDLTKYRVPSEEVWNATANSAIERDPTNIIEIVLLFE